MALMLVAVAGCDAPPPVEDPVARLMRANQELQRQVQSQARTIQVLGLVAVMMGGGLAVTLAAAWRKGRPVRP